MVDAVKVLFESQPSVSLGSFTREGNQQELTGLKFKKSFIIVVGELGRQTHRQDISGNTMIEQVTGTLITLHLNFSR